MLYMKKILGLVITISVITPKANAFDWRAELEKLKSRASSEATNSVRNPGKVAKDIKNKISSVPNSEKKKLLSTGNEYLNAREGHYNEEVKSQAKQSAAGLKGELDRIIKDPNQVLKDPGGELGKIISGTGFSLDDPLKSFSSIIDTEKDGVESTAKGHARNRKSHYEKETGVSGLKNRLNELKARLRM
jgi:hypothetical protein